MTCFWSDDAFGREPSTDDADDPPPADDSMPRCPRCETRVSAVTSVGPADHVATPCGCRVPGDLLERGGDE